MHNCKAKTSSRPYEKPLVISQKWRKPLILPRKISNPGVSVKTLIPFKYHNPQTCLEGSIGRVSSSVCGPDREDGSDETDDADDAGDAEGMDVTAESRCSNKPA